MVKKKEFILSVEEKKLCVQLAKRSIKHFFEHNESLKFSSEEVTQLPENLREKKACFVTILKNKDLRGCVGHIIAFQPLYKDILENACAAAFADNRFPLLGMSEFSTIKIEVSILTEPEEFEFKDYKELLVGINAKKDGLIISKGHNNATFLPSVWDELPKKEDFLSHLCQKAGLAPDEWKKPGLNVQKYQAIKAK